MIRKTLLFLLVTVFLSLILFRDGGPYRLLTCPLPQSCNEPIVKATTTKGYHHTIANAEKIIRSGDDVAFQFAQYENGEKVVDLFATVAGKYETFTNESLIPIFSSGKNVEAIVMMLLWEKGLIRYEDKVTVHWPEFGQNGRELVTIADVMRHSAGLCVVDTTLFPQDMHRRWTGDDWDRVADLIVKADTIEACLVPKRGYHAYMRGVILNEIVRRVDPHHRTIAQYFNEEVNQKANTQIYCGNIPHALFDQVVDIEVASAPYAIMNYLLPFVADKYLGTNFLKDQSLTYQDLDAMFDPNSLMTRYFRLIADEGVNLDARETGSSKYRKFEITSVLCVSNAHSLAKIGGALANGGVVEGIRLFSAESIKEALSEPVFSEDGALTIMPSTMTKGGFGQCDVMELPKSFFGWGGWAGSAFMFDTEARVSIGYIPVGFRKQLVRYTRGGALMKKN